MNLLQAITGVFSSPALQAAVWGMAASFALCVLLVLTKRWHGALTMDGCEGVQKFHKAPTPRIGGVPIVLGLIVAWGKAPQDTQDLLIPILFAGMPAFIFGVLEDITKRVSVMQRLLATMASGLLAWWITGDSLTRVDVWGIDWLLSFTVVSVLFTAFAVGGVANSINIIDGFNGLASTMSTLAFLGYALIAWQVGDTHLAAVALVLSACVWGFFWVNWPLGKIFLGDGGSYFIGFSLAWVAVMLIERNLGVSAFSALLVCVHPVTEVLFSIYRRRIKQLHPGQPDRLHFHSLVKQRYVRRWFPGMSTAVRNSITGLLIGAMTLVLEWIELFLYRHADRIVAVTHAFKATLMRRGIVGSKIDVITNGVDLSNFSPLPKVAGLVAELGLNGCFVAGYIGTHGLAHGLETLLDAAQILEQVRGAENIRILFLGDGAKKAELVESAKTRGLRNVVFVASVPKDQVPRYWSLLNVSIIHLRKTDLFTSVIPSKLFECMGMGIPVLHGVAGESAAIVQSEKVGEVFESNNAQQLVDALLKLRADEARLKSYQANGLMAAKRYDRRKLAENMLEILQKVIAK